jgi:hypothetical protein
MHKNKQNSWLGRRIQKDITTFRRHHLVSAAGNPRSHTGNALCLADYIGTETETGRYTHSPSCAARRETVAGLNHLHDDRSHKSVNHLCIQRPHW